MNCDCEQTCPGCIRFDYVKCCKCEKNIWINQEEEE